MIVNHCELLIDSVILFPWMNFKRHLVIYVFVIKIKTVFTVGVICISFYVFSQMLGARDQCRATKKTEE